MWCRIRFSNIPDLHRGHCWLLPILYHVLVTANNAPCANLNTNPLTLILCHASDYILFQYLKICHLVDSHPANSFFKQISQNSCLDVPFLAPTPQCPAYKCSMFIPNVWEFMSAMLTFNYWTSLFEPCHETTCLRGLRPGKTQTCLLRNFGYRN